MNKILLFTLIFLSNSLFASDDNDTLADTCGRYAKVLTKDYEFSEYIKSSNRDVHKILIRGIVSPEEILTELDTIKPKSGWAKILQNNCIWFYPIESKHVKSFNRKEALFIHYNSKYEIKPNDGVEGGKKIFKLVDEEALIVLGELKKYAENLSLNYIVLRPELKWSQISNGKEIVLGVTGGKNYKFYTYDYKDWLQEKR